MWLMSFRPPASHSPSLISDSLFDKQKHLHLSQNVALRIERVRKVPAGQPVAAAREALALLPDASSNFTLGATVTLPTRKQNFQKQIERKK